MLLTKKQSPIQSRFKHWPVQPFVRWKGCSRLRSYLQFPIPQITTLMLLVHLGFGCCWHHSHRCTVALYSSPMRDEGTCCPHYHDEASHSNCHHNDDGPHRNDDTPHRHHCNGERCSFVWSKPSPKQKGELSSVNCPVDRSAGAAVKSHLKEKLSRQICCLHRDLYHRGAQLRAHLLFNVLQI